MYKVTTRDRSFANIRIRRTERHLREQEEALKQATVVKKRQPKAKYNYFAKAILTSKTKQQRNGFTQEVIDYSRYSGAMLRAIRADNIHR